MREEVKADMRNRTRLVSVITLPDHIEDLQEAAIYNNLESYINVDRPAVVLDCSTLGVIDMPTLHFLLCCLEEAMKRNGDIRLAELSPDARSVLCVSNVDSLFHCFETVSEAVESYHRPRSAFVSLERSPAVELRSEMNAA
jgi:anti-sigma B factor antagonist